MAGSDPSLLLKCDWHQGRGTSLLEHIFSFFFRGPSDVHQPLKWEGENLPNGQISPWNFKQRYGDVVFTVKPPLFSNGPQLMTILRFGECQRGEKCRGGYIVCSEKLLVAEHFSSHHFGLFRKMWVYLFWNWQIGPKDWFWLTLFSYSSKTLSFWPIHKYVYLAALELKNMSFTVFFFSFWGRNCFHNHESFKSTFITTA